ncbi:hypothetical protein [Microbacterium sp.]|uniref:hypothetical protein n=1 Tax=Microbacterium sp. TaxID=51671 RepID=UPI0028ACCC64|nr:hypothetical protein [Microbacterium sp.]
MASRPAMPPSALTVALAAVPPRSWIGFMIASFNPITGYPPEVGMVLRWVPAVKVADLQEAANHLRELLAMLPKLHTVVTLGNFPRRGWSRFGRPGIGLGIRTIESWHPSPLAMNQLGKRAHLVASLARASRGWRPDAVADGEIHVDRDRSGITVAQWYRDAEGDRVDIHARWW